MPVDGIVMHLCQPPHPLDTLPLPQGWHLHHEADIQGPRRHPRPLGPYGNVVNQLPHLLSIAVRDVSRMESREHTRACGMTRFPLPKPEHHPQCKDSED